MLGDSPCRTGPDGADVTGDPAGSTAPAMLAHVPAIDLAVRDALGELADELRAIDRALAPAADALVAAGASGKRLRPALVCWSFAAHRGADGVAAGEAVLGAATAVELVHASALVHDDIIDHSATRRGRPSTHAGLAALHGAGWSGTAQDYGRSTAILIGDVLLAAAPRFLLRCDVAHDTLLRAHEAFVRLQVEVMAGQSLDVDAAARGTADRDQARTIAMLKSGRYSVSRPLELGALLAGADPAVAASMLRVGDPLGVAFQLGDDLLGVFGDPEVTGKPSGADLIEGKQTLLVAETLARLDGAGRDTFDRLLGDPATGAEGVDRLRDLIEACGARAAVEGHVRASAAAAHTAIDALELPVRAREDLHGLADWMTTRQH